MHTFIRLQMLTGRLRLLHHFCSIEQAFDFEPSPQQGKFLSLTAPVKPQIFFSFCLPSSILPNCEWKDLRNLCLVHTCLACYSVEISCSLNLLIYTQIPSFSIIFALSDLQFRPLVPLIMITFLCVTFFSAQAVSVNFALRLLHCRIYCSVSFLLPCLLLSAPSPFI